MTDEMPSTPAEMIALHDRRVAHRATDRRKIITPVFVALIFALIMNCAGLVVVTLIAGDTNNLARDARTAAEFAREQTDPDKIQERNDALQGILLHIECADAQRLQLVIDGLVDQGLLPTSIDTTENCHGAPPLGPTVP